MYKLTSSRLLPIFAFPSVLIHRNVSQQNKRNKKVHAGSLQGIGKEFVHLCDAGGDAEVNCAVADLDNEAAEDVGVDLFTSLASANFLKRGNRIGGRRKGRAWRGAAYLVGDLKLLSLSDVLGFRNGGFET